MVEMQTARREWGLTRMILIDSYSKGTIVEMELTGGTVITGINGQGKTTLLQLIPLFHGEDPGRIVARLEGRDSFYEHFLKSSTSYIVFEYARENGTLCLSVQHANSDGNNIIHRFVPAQYDRGMFVDDDGKLVETHLLATRLHRMGHKASSQITTRKAYREVLHRTAQRGTPEYNLAALYSIVPYGSRINGLERIINGMFSREANFDDLRNIVVRTIREDATTLKLVGDRLIAERWIANVGAYRRVMNMRGRYDSAVAHDIAKQAAEKGMIDAIGLLKGHVTWAGDKSIEIALRAKENDDKAARIREIDEPALQEHRIRLSEAEARKVTITKGIDAHERRLRSDETAGMAGKSEVLDELPGIRDAERKDRLRLDQLTAAADEVKAHAAERKDSARRQADAGREEIEAKEADLARDEDRRITQVREESQRATSDLRVREREQDDDMTSELQAALARYEQAAQSARNPMAPPEKVVALKRAQSQRDKASERERQARRIKSERDAEVMTRIRSANATEQAHGQARADMARAEKAVQEAAAFVKGEPGTLLAMLREDGGSSADELSRIIRTEVLTAPGIKASRVDQGTSLHGYEIDATAFEPDPRVDLEVARQRLETAVADRQESERILRDARDAETTAKRAAKNAGDAATMAQVEVTAAEKEVEAFQTALNRANSDHEKAIKDAARIAEEQEEVRSRELEAVQDRHRAIREDRAAIADGMVKRMDEAVMAIRSDVSALKSSLRDARSVLKRMLEEELRRIEKDLAEQMTGRGIDPDEIRRLEDDLRTARARIDAVEATRNDVMTWRAWMRDEPAVQRRRLAELDALNSEITTIGSRIDVAIACMKAERKAIADAKEALETESRTLRETVSDSETKARIGESELGLSIGEVAWDPADRIGNVHAALTRNLNARSSSKTQLEKEIQSLDVAFLQVPDTQTHDYRIKGRYDYQAETPLDGYRHWYGHIHEDTRNMLANDARGLAGQVIAFHRDLVDFEKQITAFNRELQKHLGDATAFDGIEDLTIAIVSKVKEVDYWDKVRDVSEAAAAWMRGDDDKIPGDAFINALQSLLHVWRRNGTMDTNLRALVRIEGSAKEKGNLRRFNNSEQLKNVSSNGLSYLVLVSIFIAFVNRMRAGAPTTVTWPLDELKAIDRTNTGRLVELLRRNRIELVTAFPDPDPDVMREFSNRYGLDGRRRLVTAHVEGIDDAR